MRVDQCAESLVPSMHGASKSAISRGQEARLVGLALDSLPERLGSSLVIPLQPRQAALEEKMLRRIHSRLRESLDDRTCGSGGASQEMQPGQIFQ